MPTKKMREGFSLIELIVVVSILSIIISIAVPRYSGFNEISRIAVDQATVRTLNSVTAFARSKMISIDPFLQKENNDEDLIQILVDGGYLASVVQAKSKDATFRWLIEDELWYLMQGSSFSVITLSEGLSLSGIMLGSWGGGFGEAETYTGSSKSIIIPSKIDGAIINRIGRHAFREVGLVSMVFENGSQIKQIHTDAFRGNYLSELVFPETIEKIDMRAFQDNNLSVLNLPTSLHTIEQRAFYGNNLERVTIGSNVTIGDKAFGENTDQFKQIYQDRGAGSYIWDGDNWVRQGD